MRLELEKNKHPKSQIKVHTCILGSTEIEGISDGSALGIILGTSESDGVTLIYMI